ncbi:hypothetical protein A5725_23765 [Mycobacterium kubicae]|nr:hypothetical protein A5725_23765 [Mycobacterium kubicae]
MVLGVRGINTAVKDSAMADDIDAKQARMLAVALRATIAELSEKLKTQGEDVSRRPVRRQRHQGKRAPSLRDQLTEAHRHLDDLHRRFPEALCTMDPRRTGRRPMSARPTGSVGAGHVSPGQKPPKCIGPG